MKNIVQIECYPYGSPFDVVNVLKPFIKNKIVCDIGCGAGDILEYIRVNDLCKEVKGIEKSKKRYVKKRKYIIYGDVFKNEIPFADVYLMWLGKDFDYDLLFDNLKHNCLIINLDGHLVTKEKLDNNKKLVYQDTINYHFDETKFIDNIDEYNEKIVSVFKKINVSFDIKGERKITVYDFNC